MRMLDNSFQNNFDPPECVNIFMVNFAIYEQLIKHVKRILIF